MLRGSFFCEGFFLSVGARGDSGGRREGNLCAVSGVGVVCVCVCVCRSRDLQWVGQRLDGFRGASVARIHNVIDMVAHGHEQVKEQFPPNLHFHLHGSTTLKGLPTTDDQG